MAKNNNEKNGILQYVSSDSQGNNRTDSSGEEIFF